MVRSSDWGHGKNCTLIVFNNAANEDLNSSTVNPKQVGETRYILNFGQTHQQNIAIGIHGEFENVLNEDRNKAVTYDVSRK